mgnify:CR=1 FL=1
MTPPHRGPELGLPLGMGAVAMDLLPQTKSNQTATADVVIASMQPLPVNLSASGSNVCGPLVPQPLVCHLRTYCAMIQVSHGLLTTSATLSSTLFCLSSACLVTLSCRSLMSPLVRASPRTSGPLICTAVVAAVWFLGNGRATLVPPLRRRRLNMVAGISVAAPLTCLQHIWNGRLQTGSALLSFVCRWAGGFRQEGRTWYCGNGKVDIFGTQYKY